MQYTLMHKNIAVLDMELDEVTSSIQRIDAVYRSEHLPVATASKRDGVDRAALNAWWIDRCIPASRSGAAKYAGAADALLRFEPFRSVLGQTPWQQPPMGAHQLL